MCRVVVSVGVTCILKQSSSFRAGLRFGVSDLRGPELTGFRRFGAFSIRAVPIPSVGKNRRRTGRIRSVARIGVVDLPRWGSWRGGMLGLMRCSTCRPMCTLPLELLSQLACPFSELHGKIIAPFFALFLKQTALLSRH